MAMGFKKPVVITDVFYEKKWVKDLAGLVAKAKDSDSVADKLLQLLHQQSLANQYGNNGYRYASNNFSWQKAAQQYFQIYSKLV